MKKIHTLILSGLIMTPFFAASAFAGTVSCPPVSQFKQVVESGISGYQLEGSTAIEWFGGKHFWECPLGSVSGCTLTWGQAVTNKPFGVYYAEKPSGAGLMQCYYRLKTPGASSTFITLTHTYTVKPTFTANQGWETQGNEISCPGKNAELCTWTD